MLFSENKYTRWYYNIIDRAKARVLPAGSYTEKHHVIPKSLGGSNYKDNLVKLTAREHFVCHWLLTKMVDGDLQKKMAYACKRMMTGHKDTRYQVTGRKYELLKEGMNTLLKGRKFTQEWKDKLSVAARNRASKESNEARQIRRNTMINVNKSRKGERRLATSGSKNPFYGKGFFGSDNHFYGKHHNEETLARLRTPKPKFQCEHCNAIVGGRSNYIRWHGNNCKLAKENQNS